MSLCIWHVMLVFCDPRVQCGKWNISLVPSRPHVNAPIVLGWWNNLTLPAHVSLKLLTWWLESVVGLLLTRLATAVYCPLCWRLRTLEMRILAMWMMEKYVRYLSEQLFLAELSQCHKCHGIYRHQERSRSREVCQPFLLFSLLSSGWKLLFKKGI